MKRHRSFELGSAKILEGMGYVNIATGTEVSGIICIINMHLSHIFDEGELDKNVVVIMSLTSLLWKVEHHTEE